MDDTRCKSEFPAAPMSSGVALAQDGQVWICAACGKTSRTKYGFDDDDRWVADRGWDESCMLNAVLVYADSIQRNERGIVTAAKEVEP